MKHRYNDLDLALESEAYFRELATVVHAIAMRCSELGLFSQFLTMNNERKRLARRHKRECAAIERLKGVRDAR